MENVGHKITMELREVRKARACPAEIEAGAERRGLMQTESRPLPNDNSIHEDKDIVVQLSFCRPRP